MPRTASLPDTRIREVVNLGDNLVSFSAPTRRAMDLLYMIPSALPVHAAVSSSPSPSTAPSPLVWAPFISRGREPRAASRLPRAGARGCLAPRRQGPVAARGPAAALAGARVLHTSRRSHLATRLAHVWREGERVWSSAARLPPLPQQHTFMEDMWPRGSEKYGRASWQDHTRMRTEPLNDTARVSLATGSAVLSWRFGGPSRRAV